MNSAVGSSVNINVVHEAEAQRQHVRVRMPVKLTCEFENGQSSQCKLYDISAGGFSLNAVESLAKNGKVYEGVLTFTVDTLKIALDIQFCVNSVDAENGRINCEFNSMGAQEVSTLRYLITAFLSGELVSTGDIINTLSRENFTRPRKKTGNTHQSLLVRSKAIVISALLLVIGLMVFSGLVYQVYDHYFVIKATKARLVIDSIDVPMPRDGFVYSLISEGQTQLEAGKAIATYETSASEVLKFAFQTDDPVQAAAIAEALNKNTKGIISSPCDCELISAQFKDGEYSAKGKALFQLAQKSAKPEVAAVFDYKDLDSLIVGVGVTVEIPGETSVQGVITHLQLGNDTPDSASDGAINAMITLKEALPAAWVYRPVTVKVMLGQSYSDSTL